MGIMEEERIMVEIIRKEETEDRKKGARMKGKRGRRKRRIEERKMEDRETIIDRCRKEEQGRERWSYRRRTGYGEKWDERKKG